MGFGVAELLIIGALVVAVFIFIGVIQSARNKAQAAANDPLFESKPVAGIDWDAIADAELQSYLPKLKIQAIKRYRDLTGAGLKEAKEAVEYAIEHPEGMKKGKSGGAVDTDGAGVRDLLAEGRIEEAVDVYAAFMGADEYTARDAITQMQREEEAESRLGEAGMDEVRQLVADGNKIAAIKLYREMTNLGLKEAKDEIDRMEREGY